MLFTLFIILLSPRRFGRNRNITRLEINFSYSQIVHHNPCVNLFILYNNYNSFDNQESEINKNDIFYVSSYCLLRKLSSYHQIYMEQSKGSFA